MKQKYIITDIDGVVLDWEEGFNVWMQHHGHELVEGYQFEYSIGDRYGMSKTFYNVFEDSIYKGNNNVSGDTTIIGFFDSKLNSITVIGGAEGIYLPNPSENKINFPVKYSADKMNYLFKNKKTEDIISLLVLKKYFYFTNQINKFENLDY